MTYLPFLLAAAVLLASCSALAGKGAWAERKAATVTIGSIPSPHPPRFPGH